MDISEEVEVFEWRDVPSGDFAVLGDPVGHSLSPRMHEAAYRVLDLDLTYRAVRVPYEDFGEAMDRLRSLGYQGVNCTVPLKEVAFEWCPSFLGLAGELGSVNTINLVTQQGTNTDLPGFLKVCEDFGVGSGARVLILGAGGTARSLVVGCSRAGMDVWLWNRSVDRRDRLVGEMDGRVSGVMDSLEVNGFDLVVNATSASLSGVDLGVNWEGGSRALAFELAYGNKLSPFLVSARDAGLRVIDGFPMLVEQGALAFEYWLGKAAPREAMLRAVGL